MHKPQPEASVNFSGQTILDQLLQIQGASADRKPLGGPSASVEEAHVNMSLVRRNDVKDVVIDGVV
jgi:hypothetical protein